MDQTLINWVFAGGGAAFGWVLKVVWDAIQELKRDLREIEKDVVRRDDFKDIIKEIKDDMKDGFSKIDTTLGVLFKKIDHLNEK
jgi:hypothetical protein